MHSGHFQVYMQQTNKRIKKKKIVNIQKYWNVLRPQVRVVRCINKHYVIKNDAVTANTQFITLLYKYTTRRDLHCYNAIDFFFVGLQKRF